MRIWHDDVRWPPDPSWKVARTNDEAKQLLNTNTVYEISLDHDLGAEPAPMVAPGDPDPEEIWAVGASKETGFDLVVWMIENDKVPPKVVIHSWNYDGAKRMAAALKDAGHEAVEVKPYEAKMKNGKFFNGREYVVPSPAAEVVHGIVSGKPITDGPVVD